MPVNGPGWCHRQQQSSLYRTYLKFIFFIYMYIQVFPVLLVLRDSCYIIARYFMGIVILRVRVDIYCTGTVSHCSISSIWWVELTIRAPSQYPIRRLFVRSRKVSKSRDLYLELSDRYEIWQALRQQCCRSACQISKRYDNLKYQSRGFETLRDLTKRRLSGYWDGAQNLTGDLALLSDSTTAIRPCRY